MGRSITFPLYESIVSMGSDRTEGACIKAQLPALPPCGRPGFVRKRNQGPVVKFGFRAWTNPKNEARIGQGPVHRQSRKGGRVCLLAQKGRPVRRTAFCIERSPSLLLLFSQPIFEVSDRCGVSRPGPYLGSLQQSIQADEEIRKTKPGAKARKFLSIDSASRRCAKPIRNYRIRLARELTPS